MTIPAGVSKDDLRYGYIPTLWICILFVVLFAISTLIHLGQAIRFRLWWLLPTAVLAGIGEIVGWSGRLWSSKTFLGSAMNPYLMQITATIISPTPLLAANFVILGILIGHLGTQYSRLTPKWYTIIFCSADVVALVVQAVGGASASSAAENNGDASTGGNIMLGGIVVQLVAITIYAALAVEFMYHYFTNKPLRQDVDAVRGPFDRRIQFMVSGLTFSTLCIFIRAIYRTIELSDGWNGRIIETEVYFNVLDGAMIVLAIYTINICHPGFLLSHVQKSVDVKVRGNSSDSRDDMTLSQRDSATRAFGRWKDGSDKAVTGV